MTFESMSVHLSLDLTYPRVWKNSVDSGKIKKTQPSLAGFLQLGRKDVHANSRIFTHKRKHSASFVFS